MVLFPVPCQKKKLGIRNGPLFSQRVCVYSNLFNSKRLLRTALLVYLNGLHLGKRHQALVADNLAKHGIQAIEMGRLVERDEELRAVSAGPFVGHGNEAPAAVSQRGSNLVFERTAPYRLAALWIFGCWVGGCSCLHHEFGDQAVEGRLVVVAGGAKGQKVLLRARVLAAESRAIAWEMSFTSDVLGTLSQKTSILMSPSDV